MLFNIGNSVPTRLPRNDPWYGHVKVCTCCMVCSDMAYFQSEKFFECKECDSLMIILLKTGIPSFDTVHGIY